jgi:5-formyltetrahydrofolate cyclo-ligase
MSPKRALRHVTRSKRDAIHVDERHQMAQKIKDRLLNQDEYKEAGAVLFYAAFGSEVPTTKMMEAGLEAGKTIVLPITDTKTNRLIIRRISDLSCLVKNKYGIPEPAIDSTDSFNAHDIDLIIVPGIVFDEEGWRIGYGGGYYDRFLSRINPSVPWVSVAFELQIVPRIPSESHDLPVDKIVTEKRVIDARGSRTFRRNRSR